MFTKSSFDSESQKIQKMRDEKGLVVDKRRWKEKLLALDLFGRKSMITLYVHEWFVFGSRNERERERELREASRKEVGNRRSRELKSSGTRCNYQILKAFFDSSEPIPF